MGPYALEIRGNFENWDPLGSLFNKKEWLNYEQRNRVESL